MGLDWWFDTRCVRRILAVLVWDSASASCVTRYARLRLLTWLSYGLDLLCEGPEPFVYCGETGAHKGGYEDLWEVVGFKFVAGEANEGGTDNEEVKKKVLGKGGENLSEGNTIAAVFFMDIQK